MAIRSFKNYLSIHGSMLGLYRGLGTAGDAWLSSEDTSLFQGVLEGVAAGLVSLAAQSSQALGLQLTAAVNQFATVPGSTYANLPPAVIGMKITVINGGGSAIQICGSPATVDTIDSIASATGVTVTNGKNAIFIATVTAVPASGVVAAVPGAWFSIGGARAV